MADLTSKDIPDSEKTFLTPEQIKEGESIQLKIAAKRYLAETDWYAVRKAETGKAVPSDVLTKRAQARIDASD
jgi:hypothetical protein